MFTAARRFSLRFLLSGLTLCSAGARALLLAVACFCAANAWAQGPYTLTVNTTVDSNDATNNCGGSVSTGSVCSLRDAITQANSDNSDLDGDTIVFQSGLTGTITIGSGGDAAALPPITASMAIQGSGALHLTISGANTYQVLAVDSGARVLISGLTIANGKGADGGGIENSGTLLTVTGCTFSGNSAGAQGGAIYNIGGSTLTVTNSTFSGNSAGAQGGAIYNIGGSTLTVTNSTFSGNSAGTQGGAIFNDLSATLTANNNIFSGNFAGGGSDTGGGIYNYSGATANASYNVYYNNLGGGSESDCSGCTTNSNAVSATANPLTLPLGWYGGATQTFLPQPGSAAICAGSASLAAYAGLSFDQRGETMGPNWSCNAGAAVDAGAVQSNYIQVTSNTDAGSGYSDCTSAGTTTCTLRDAIALADFGSGGGDIDFAPSALPNINLGSGLTITGNGVNIIGPGASAFTVNGGGTSSNFSVFEILPTSTATLYGLTVSNGNVNGATDPGGGGIFNFGTLTLLSSTVSGNTDNAVYSGDGGGGILNGGTLTLLSSTVSGNTADLAPGGGIASLAGIVTITDSTISDNMSANIGGAIGDSVGGGIFISAGTVTIADSTISGNTAYYGGGILNAGSMVITESTISGNTANGGSATDGISLLIYGGGIANSGALALLSSTISGNSAICNTSECVSGSVSSGGGGIANLDGTGTLILANSIVEGNMAIGNSVTNADIDNSSIAITPPSDPTLLFNILLGNIVSIAEGNTPNFDGLFSSAEGTINDVGGNIINTSSSAATVNPGLSALQYNGTGATVQTMIPLPNSPAICAGKTSLVPGSITTDERGFPLTTPGYCTSGQIDSGAVQTNYTGLAFAVQPTNTLVNTAITPAPAVEITETNTSTGATDTVSGVPIPIYYSGGPNEIATPANLSATTASTTIDGKTVNAATYSLTPNTTGSGFTLAIGPSGEGIAVSSSSVLTGPAGNSFDVYGVLADIQLSVSPSPVVAGGSVIIAATAVDANGNVVPNNNDTVLLTTWLGVVPVQLTNGVGSISIPAPTAAGGSYTVSGLDETEISVSVLPASFTVTPGALSSVTVTGYPASVIVGVSATGTVVLLDAYGNVLTGTSGTGTVVTSENATPIPVTITNGVGSFSTSFATAASSQSITASFGGISGEQQNITVAPVPGFVVTSTGDSDSGVAGNCPANAAANSPAGNCTLRDALAAASAAGTGTITFAASAFPAPNGATITLGIGGTLTIPSNTTIQGLTTGSGATLANLVTVSGGGVFTVFTVASGVTAAAISNLNVVDGNGGNGGGIDNSGTLTVTNSTVSGNTAAVYGGGIYDEGGTLTVTGSTFSGNSATGDGGGIFNGGGTLTVTNSTFSGNTAADASGGGLFIAGGAATVTNSTVSGNTAAGDVGGGIFNDFGTLTLANSIVAGNSAAVYADIYGSYTDNGGNQVGTSTTGTSNLAPGLAALGNYGGPTQTLIPLPGSPAICAGAAANIPSGVTTDQRGEPRTNTTYPGYSTTACVDAGSVQTGYALAFSTQPLDVVAGATMTPAPAVTLTESGTPFTASAETIPLALGVGNSGTLSGGSAATSTSTTTNPGIATYSNLSISAAGGPDTLLATLSLNPALATPLSLVTTSNQFTVSPNMPTVMGVSPSSGPAAGGTSVTITGTNFTGATAVSFGSVPATSFTVVNATTITAVAPSNTGTVDVTVTTPAGTSATSPADQFTYNSVAPTLSFATIPSQTYGVNASFPVSATSASSGAVSYTVSGPATVSGSTVTITGAGTITITANQAASGTYSATTAMTMVSVAKASLTVTANAATMPYGGPLPMLSGTLTGVVAGDGITASYATNATVTSPAGGTYSVTATLNDPNNRLSNYTVTNTPAAFTITKATATVTLGNLSATYTGSPIAATATTNPAGLAVSLTYNGSATAPTKAGSYTVDATITNVNYTGSATGMLVIAQATPTIAWAAPAAITYGTALSATQLDATASVAGSFTYSPVVGTVLTAGTHTLSVSFTPTDTTDYASPATATVMLTVNKATSTVTWATPAAITYGTALSATQLDATASVAGSFTYSPVAGTVLTAGTHTLSVSFTPTDTTDYPSATATVVLTVNKATPTVTWATPAAIIYGTPLSATQLDATASVAGTFTYSPAAGTVLTAGTHTLSVSFTPTDTTDYASPATATIMLTVNKATPTVTWAMPAAITYGTPLSATQLDATASYNGSTVAGTFTYSPAAGTVLTAGTHTLSVSFTPTDTTDYASPATATVMLTVNNATPTVTWAMPAAITYGTPLSATQLDATASVAGTFTYSPAAGTVLTAGTHTLSVSFTPTDTTDYPSATATVMLTVNKATSTVTWATPAAITYGTALSATQLDATASVAGSFTYSPVAGTVLTAGTHTLSVSFTPTDTTDYPSATATVMLTVNKATPVLSWTTPAAITYGTALSATQLDATASVAGTFTYSPVAGTVLTAGTHTLSASFTPTDTTDYASPAAVTTNITVNGATLTVAANNATRIYGTANPAFTGTVSGAVNGDTFTESYTTTATQASAVGSYNIVPSVTGTGLSDYSVTYDDGTLSITQAASSVALAASATSITPLQSVTFTATVADSTTGSIGTPTGTVTFFDNGVQLGTAVPLVGGTATLVAPSLPAGATAVITAMYSGDSNFLASKSATAVSVVVAPLDFTFTNTGTAAYTAAPGAVATYSFELTPLYGSYAGTVSFSVTGLPTGAVASFTPSSVAAGGGATPVVMTVQTAAAIARGHGDGSPFSHGIVLALLLLPFTAKRRVREKLKGRVLLLVLLMAGLTATLTGCGSTNGFLLQSPQTYTLTVTATGGALEHSQTVTLVVQ